MEIPFLQSFFQNFPDKMSSQTNFARFEDHSHDNVLLSSSQSSSSLLVSTSISKLNFTKRENERRLNKIRNEISESKTKRKQEAKSMYLNRHEGLIRLNKLLSVPKNKFAKPLYQTLVSKCPRTKISASRLVCVLNDTYYIENMKILRSIVRRVVSDMIGNPLYKEHTSYYNHSDEIDDYLFDYRELCCGLRLFSRPGEDLTLQLLAMFDMLDLKNSGYITRLDLAKMFNIPVSSDIEHVRMKDLTYRAFGENFENKIARVMFRCIVQANRELLDFFQELRQLRIPLNTRLIVCRKQMQQNEARANFVWRKLRWRSVRSFYERHCLADNIVNRWNRWKSYTKGRRMLKRAEMYHIKFCKTKTLRYFQNFVSWRCNHRRLRLMARNHFETYVHY